MRPLQHFDSIEICDVRIGGQEGPSRKKTARAERRLVNVGGGSVCDRLRPSVEPANNDRALTGIAEISLAEPRYQGTVIAKALGADSFERLTFQRGDCGGDVLEPFAPAARGDDDFAIEQSRVLVDIASVRLLLGSGRSFRRHLSLRRYR